MHAHNIMGKTTTAFLWFENKKHEFPPIQEVLTFLTFMFLVPTTKATHSWVVTTG